MVSDKISPGVSAILSNGVVVRFWVGLSSLVSVTWEANDMLWFIKRLVVRLLLLVVYLYVLFVLFFDMFIVLVITLIYSNSNIHIR